MTKRGKWHLFMIAVLLMAPLRLSAQLTGATISGTVRDESGAVMPNATVAIRNQETGTTRTVSSDS